MDALVEETVASTQSIMERSESPTLTITASDSAPSANRSTNQITKIQANQVKHAIAVPSPGGSVSIVHVAIPNNQGVHVQSVIQQANQQSVIQAPSGTTLQSLPKNQVILLNKLTGQGSVIHSADTDSGVHPVQLISAKHENDGETVTAVLSPEDESKKRREILARRPSYRKILSELSSTDTHSAVATLGASNNNQNELKDDQTTTATVVEDGEGGGTITVGGTQYHTSSGLIKVVQAGGTLQLATQDASGGIQGLQTLTMSNAGGQNTPTIVQYAQGQDGGQFFVPVTVSAADLQAYGIRTTGNAGSSLGQSVVMTQSGAIQSPVHMIEEVSKKRELRLLKNREAAKECRRKKKEYIKCLENRVAVLENQNKALIEELKSLKELYCQKND